MATLPASCICILSSSIGVVITIWHAPAKPPASISRSIGNCCLNNRLRESWDHGVLFFKDMYKMFCSSWCTSLDKGDHSTLVGMISNMLTILTDRRASKYIGKKRESKNYPALVELLATWLVSYGCLHRLPGHLTQKLHSNGYLQLSRITK
ncbi:hypothetical protein ALC53_14116 [Atta colombica]|uniref:Uncharacterized protein n=1 Tax=Atta colombica TaxID=520822 RepID=A0A195ATT1_9HYME|nr:hypothetical protein ALC53_14116 [Atta colombica]